MTKQSIWTNKELAREQARGFFVAAVTAIFGVVRYANISESFSKGFQLSEPINILDFIIASWIGYLILMALALSDDIIPRPAAEAARIFGYLTFFFGLFIAVVALTVLIYVKSPQSAIFAGVLLAVLMASYVLSQKFRELLRSRLGMSVNNPSVAKRKASLSV